MSTPVHGKTSLAEMLLADGAAPGKRGDDSHDKTNTVDFGATLTSLIDQNVAGKAAATGDVGPSAATPGASKHGQKASTTFDPNSAEADDRFSETAAMQVGAKSRAPASSVETASHTSRARGDSFTALLRNHKSTNEPQVAIEQSTLSGHDAKANPGKDPSTPAAGDKTTVDPATQPASTLIAAQSAVAATIDAPVPNPDTALDFRKQPFASKGSDGASSAADTQITASKNFAKVANPAPIDAEADIAAHSTPHVKDAAHPPADRATDGTSTALSSPKSMNPADPKNAPQTFAKVTADSTTSSSGTVASQTQMEAAVAEIAPQEERIRTNTKDTPSQPAAASGLANDSTHAAAAQPVAPTTEAAAIRLNPEVSATRDPNRTVSITVQLASGQTAQASVREHAGAVDVKIVTPTAASAQRVSSEMDGMRQNLDAAGIKLGNAEVSYQHGDGGGRQGREGYQPPAQNPSANGKEVFIMHEVVQ